MTDWLVDSEFAWRGLNNSTNINVVYSRPKVTDTLFLRNRWAPSSEFVSSSIPSWQISTAHAQPFRGAMDLACCLKVPLESLLVWASSGGSGETVRMRRLAWTFAARKGDKYQIGLTRPNLRNRLTVAVNCWVIIHCLDVSCNGDQITSAKWLRKRFGLPRVPSDWVRKRFGPLASLSAIWIWSEFKSDDRWLPRVQS